MPALRALALFLVLAAPAHADLYRWVDPDSGSVKLSSVPPVDPRVNAEVLPYRGPAPLPKAASAVPGTTAATPGTTQPSVALLEARLRELFTQLSAATPQDFSRGGEALRQQMDAYDAVRAELDRLDPAGAPRRQAEAMTIIERLKQGIGAGASPAPSAQR